MYTLDKRGMINSALSGTGGFVFGGWALLTKVSKRPMTELEREKRPAESRERDLGREYGPTGDRRTDIKW